jgi:hypothetical protein
MQVNFADIGKHLVGARACQHTQATAGGSGDNAYIVGDGIDLQSFASRPTSAVLVGVFETTLAENKTLTLKSKVEDDTVTGMGSAAVYSYRTQGTELSHGVVATGGSGGSTEKGVIVRSVDLRGIRRFFRGSIHQDLSAANTDTCELMGVWMFFSGEAPAAGSV